MPSLDPVFCDLRLAVRGLVRDKGFTATALLTFALCLGANVALFAVVSSVLIRPLPYPNPAQLVAVFNKYPKAGVDRSGVAALHYLERRAETARGSRLCTILSGAPRLPRLLRRLPSATTGRRLERPAPPIAWRR